MAKNIELNVGTVLTKIEIKDDDGIVLGFLKLNLMDARIVTRIHDCEKFFSGFSFDETGVDGIVAIDRAMEEKFSYLLGYDCRESLFGVLSPTTVFRNGEMFAIAVLEKISEAYSEEVKERAAARMKAVRKYTDKYST